MTFMGWRFKKTGGLVGSKETDRARGNHGNAAVTRRGKINKAESSLDCFFFWSYFVF